MRLRRYRGKHLKRRPRKHGAAALTTAAAVCVTAPAAQAAQGRHVVRKGETLSAIAARYGIGTAALARANELADPNHIVAGSRLRVPGSATRTASRSHEVRAGETLSAIAARYGTTVSALARANHLSDANLIVIGSRLRVPGSTAAPASEAARRHTVRPGETLASIAARYGTTVAGLATVNDIDDPNLVVIGRTLIVPGGAGDSAPAAAATTSVATSVESSLERSAAEVGVDAALVKGLAWHESGWQQHVISAAGAIGVMQVMPDTADYVNQVLGGGSLNVRKADDNVRLGAMYLRQMIAIMGSEDKALAAYYSGPGNVGHRLTKDQRRYVSNVKANQSRY